MFYLVAFCPFLSSILKANGLKDLNRFFAVHNWGGFSLYDLIMPLFIFVCGAAIPLAMRRRLDAEGRPTRAFHTHVWSRFALLWIMGMLAQGNLETLDLHQISPFSNTLQMIAIGYAVAAYVLLAKRWMVRLLIPVLISLGYGIFVHFGGDYTATENATFGPEVRILSFLLPSDNPFARPEVIADNCTWFLPSLMMPVITLCGAFATEILSAQSLLLLAALYVLTDIYKLRRGTGLLLLYGQHALAAYFLGCICMSGAVVGFSQRLLVGFKQFAPAIYRSTVQRVSYFLVITALLVIWHGYREWKKEHRK